MFAQKHLQGRSIAFIEKIAALSLSSFFLLSPLTANAAPLDLNMKQVGNSHFSKVVVCMRALNPNTGNFLREQIGAGSVSDFSYYMKDREKPIRTSQPSTDIKFERELFAEGGCFNILDASREVRIYRISLDGAQGFYKGKWYQAELEKDADGKDLYYRVPEHDNSDGLAGALIIPMRIVLIKDKKSAIDRFKDKIPPSAEKSTPMSYSRGEKSLALESVDEPESKMSVGATN